jgi:hypothetical protein
MMCSPSSFANGLGGHLSTLSSITSLARRERTPLCVVTIGRCKNGVRGHCGHDRLTIDRRV